MSRAWLRIDQRDKRLDPDTSFEGSGVVGLSGKKSSFKGLGAVSLSGKKQGI